MKTQITILGLGQIGTSIGLALAKYKDKIHRVGHDKYRISANKAKALDAVDNVTLTLSGAVMDADIILLSLPFHEIYPVMKHIAEDLKDSALVIDTSPLKQSVFQWAEELFPDNCFYVGITPVLNSSYLKEFNFGQETAQPDLFEGCLMAVVSGSSANEDAVNTTINLVQLLGASPYFIDAAEVDGLMTMTHILPHLLAVVLSKVCQESPGWLESRKIAGKTYAQVTNPMVQDDLPEALAAAMVYNRENTTRLINDLIRELVELRDQPDQDQLEVLFQKLQKDRDSWWLDRKENRWMEIEGPQIPKRGGLLSQLLGFHPPKPPQDSKK
jgi:prephenate dehydrogenase